MHTKSMKRKLSPSDVGLEAVNEKFPVVSLSPKAPPLMTDVKVEDVVAENASRS